MFPNSLRWRLPVTYALIALLTAVALNVILAVNLTLDFRGREHAYLLHSGDRISERLAPFVADGAESLRNLAQALAAVYRVRLRVNDAHGNELLDTGPPGPLPIDSISPPGGELQVLGEAGAFETVYGFDQVHRSSQIWSFEFTDPATGRATGELIVTDGPAYGPGIVQRVLRVGVVASAAAVLLAAGTGWLVSRQMVRPLVALTETSAQMAGGDFSARAEADSDDEINELARSFNAMADQVEATLHTLRSFVADAAHELHTPLTALKTDLDLAAGEVDLPQARAYMSRARVQVERLADLSADLLDLSRLEAGGVAEHTEVELGGLLRDLAETYASRAEQAGLTFELAAPSAPMPVRGHAGQLRRAVGNLMENAVKFTPSPGTVALALTAEADQVRITVSDTGIGVPPEDVPRLFGRFHRGRNAAGYRGSGLGLAIVRAIVEQHGGSAKAESRTSGTSVTLTLPSA